MVCPDADVRFASLAAECDGAQPTAQRAITAESYLADVRQLDGAVVLVEAPEFNILARQSERVVRELLAGLGVLVLAGRNRANASLRCIRAYCRA
jgi:hypothetical protein